ncbi:MAG: M23 family metallopeptidase [Ignavibacteriaceae bacterium]|jgi:murein DD-endopeptidase MepM/ murein hydrolase activator NlpD
MQRIKNLLTKYGFSIVVLPNSNQSVVPNKTFKGKVLFLAIMIYTMILFLLLSLFYTFTPAKYLLLRESDIVRVKGFGQFQTLNDKINVLVLEIEKLKKTNQNLKNAIYLGDSTLIKKPTSEKKEIGGSIWNVFQELFFAQNEPSIIFRKPINGFVSRSFSANNGHFGTDFSVKIGTPIYSAANGYVVFSDYTVNDGYMLIIAHADDYITVYKHCSQLLKSTRDFVTQGELIALSGNTGKLTTGPHLHFEIWKNGFVLDPEKIFVNY